VFSFLIGLGFMCRLDATIFLRGPGLIEGEG